jgi:hypothetical protein
MSESKKMVIVGMDGLDPVILRAMMAKGELPNFKALAAQGSFSDLQTSNPPQSPVAWSCFISGHNPGHHDVFDFVVRNPETYLPEVGMTESKDEESGLKKIFSGLSGPSLKTKRKGPAFWDDLGHNNVKSVILRCPVTFPAQPLNGKLLTGMGTPDVKGTQGVFTFFTSNAVSGHDVQGRVVQVTPDGGKVRAELPGPMIARGQKRVELTIPFTVTKIDGTQTRLEIQGQMITLKPGEWSDWVRVKFNAGFFKSIHGICRTYPSRESEGHLTICASFCRIIKM